ncbi:MAG: hypothetical protein A3G76_07035 [Acidobacteria bacterium RIFCSPLOWO2_12_FULL_65_11]|nr:MAG: hypothetical protein A3G76_07035 [Acidobacteria bacterium RIFCSPLOWO2_12_FULL_65_11]
MSLALHIKNGFMKENIRTARGTGETKACAQFLEALADRIVNSRFALRRKSRHFTVGPVNHMPGKDNDTWQLKEPLDAASVHIQLLHQQPSIAPRRL